jgi:DegV family protein with EDD domain
MVLRIVTDSTCDLPRSLTQALGITVVPLTVVFGDEELLDGVDIQPQQFFQRLDRERTTPTTAAPTPEAFQRVYEQLVRDGATEILSIHISAKLSMALDSARQAAEAVHGARIALIDSHNVSVGLAMGVVEVAKAARAGATLEEAEAIAVDVFRRTHVFFTVDTLEFLRRGGRLSRGQALLGTLLRVKPILAVRDGEVVAVGRVNTRQRAIDDLIARCADLRPLQHVFVVHAAAADEAYAVRAALAAHDPGATVTQGNVGPVVGVHTGPGVVGVGVVTALDAESPQQFERPWLCNICGREHAAALAECPSFRPTAVARS